ncbi:MAG: multicopper oxidase domain-containing protein, partial [Singulisphaera sp.]
NGDDDLEKMCLVEPDGYRRYVPGTNPVGGSGSFMGGPRRDIALLLPHDEVVVFMRWKDFLGKHVMHCHNVVHEDHGMMIRWEIVPPRHISTRPGRSERSTGSSGRTTVTSSRPSQSSSQENLRRGRPPIR